MEALQMEESRPGRGEKLETLKKWLTMSQVNDKEIMQ